MKTSKDPFEAEISDDESPPESPSGVHVSNTQNQEGEEDDVYTQNPNPNNSNSKGKGKAKEVDYDNVEEEEEEEEDMELEDEEFNNNNVNNNNNNNNGDNNNDNNNGDNNNDDDNYDDEDDNVGPETETEREGRKRALSEVSGSGAESTDPRKMAKMQSILTQFTDEQMTRYESFRRSGFQKATMKRLLVSITGSQKISIPMTIVVSGIAKMFVGELVETARVVMAERKDSGPIRPCHIRESYRRLKLEGKIPKRSVPRLFR